MRYTPLILLAISSIFVAQAAPNQVDFSADEISIYRDFLLHYPLKLGDLVGMQAATGDFARMKKPSDPSLAEFRLVIPTQSERKFPADIMKLTSEEAVTRRLADAGKVVPISKRFSPSRPDGYVRTNLKLSEIAFDEAHQLAVFVFSASCHCKGGDGGVAVYRKAGNVWHLEKVIDTWIG